MCAPSGLRGGIHKRHKAFERCDLINRRLQVPQRFTDVPDDGDGFTFGATVMHGDSKRVVIVYDYTGEQEQWPVSMVRQWLEPDTDPLCHALEAVGLSGLNRLSGRAVVPAL